MIEKLRLGECVAFVGSGPSLALYKSWTRLIDFICRECGLTIDDRHWEKDVEVDALLALADAAKRLDLYSYRKALADEFAKDVTIIPPVYQLLFELPFLSYVTLNFDPLLAKLAARHNKEVFAYPNLYGSKIGGGNVFYAHGRVEERRVPNVDEIILGTQSFSEAYEASSRLSSFLTDIFTTRSVIFIGCGLKEPELHYLFHLSKDFRQDIEVRTKEVPPERYIFLPNAYAKPNGGLRAEEVRESDIMYDDTAERQEDRTLSERGIHVIRYPPGNNHVELEKSLELMLDLVGQPQSFEEEALPR